MPKEDAKEVIEEVAFAVPNVALRREPIHHMLVELPHGIQKQRLTGFE